MYVVFCSLVLEFGVLIDYYGIQIWKDTLLVHLSTRSDAQLREIFNNGKFCFCYTQPNRDNSCLFYLLVVIRTNNCYIQKLPDDVFLHCLGMLEFGEWQKIHCVSKWCREIASIHYCECFEPRCVKFHSDTKDTELLTFLKVFVFSVVFVL